jgi:hypothetical protein
MGIYNELHDLITKFYEDWIWIKIEVFANPLLTQSKYNILSLVFTLHI